jgi:hypothetical protein
MVTPFGETDVRLFSSTDEPSTDARAVRSERAFAPLRAKGRQDLPNEREEVDNIPNPTLAVLRPYVHNSGGCISDVLAGATQRDLADVLRASAAAVEVVDVAVVLVQDEALGLVEFNTSPERERLGVALVRAGAGSTEPERKVVGGSEARKDACEKEKLREHGNYRRKVTE